MPHLYLLRHAKSSWDDPGLTDHDRPLAPRGRRAAKAIGAYLGEQGIEPELVLCSSATRARETFERLRLPDVEIEPGLYGASANVLLARLREVPPAVESVMLVGHNPGIEDVVHRLAPGALRGKFPTAALATLAMPDWHGDAAELEAFIRPRDL
jgi:phosphohistidine phosphatase